MNRTAALFLFLLATLSLRAQTPSDYSVSFVDTWKRERIPQHSELYHAVQVTRPADAGNVVVELDIPGDDVAFSENCTGPRPWRCTLSPDSSLIGISAKMNAPGSFTASARLVGVSDANPANDLDSWTFQVVGLPALSLSAYGGRYDVGATGTISVGVYNNGAAAKDVVVTVTLPQDGTFTGKIIPASGQPSCDVTPAKVVCTVPELANGAFFGMAVEVALPDRLEGGSVPIEATVTSSTPDFDPDNDRFTHAFTLIPQIVVSNTNDEGAGSLRQAILDARQRCAEELCTIGFRIPGQGENGRFVIRPRSELPVLEGMVKLDGATQTRFGGDTNPDGPEIVLDGSQSPPARGLVLGGPSCEMYVLDLAIENFSAPGIAAYRGLNVQQCPVFQFPNTLIARNHLARNYRGLVVVGDGYLNIGDNVIRDNQRAGIFVDGATYVAIRKNHITGNGASGIFLNPGVRYLLQAAVVEENVISGNAEWGIARTRRGDIQIRKNSIFGNRYLAIDSGLDLETPNAPQDQFFESDIPNKPVLISAQYDPASGKTRVRGRLDSDTLQGISSFTIDVYASRSRSTAGYAEAERWLTTLVLPRENGHADFEVEVDGDLRGQFITATNTRFHVAYWDDPVWDTSEVSNALPVQ
jgi:parallel beta-helix repeat protein